MKKLLLILFFGLSIAICNAQIAPPKQTDTLVITSVKYNYADIYRSNWPCEIIYKSTENIRIDNQTFNIANVQKRGFDEIYFTVYDAEDSSKNMYILEFIEKSGGTIVISFSGYEFTCIKKEHRDPTIGRTTGEPNARLAGRSVNGTLPRPSYGVHADGKVVVKIWVDQNGNVTKAQAGVEGTTATNKTLWQAAYKAAMGAHFNMDASAPALQEGTITYIFSVR
jgi:TonB family protein